MRPQSLGRITEGLRELLPQLESGAQQAHLHVGFAQTQFRSRLLDRESFHLSLLGHIFGIVVMARDAPGDSVNPAFVPRGQRLENRQVANFGPAD